MKTKKITAVILVALLFLSGCSNKYKKAYELGLKYLTEGNYEQAVLSFTQAINIEENLKDIKAEYLEAVNSWNEVLGSLGLSVKDLYDHRILTQNLK